jgi:Leucine-rich repeat (LRR) protein
LSQISSFAMKKFLTLTLPLLLLGLLLLVAFSGPKAHAQSDICPRIIRDGSMLRTDSAQSYQWYKNGERIPGATEQSYQPLGASASYSVEVQGRASAAFGFALGQEGYLVGQAFDEYLRPVANVRITVGNLTTESDVLGRFRIGLTTVDSAILLRGEKAGHWTSQRRIIPTGRETHVQIMLLSQPFEHELSAERGGTISRGPFFLTLQPNGVLDANNQPYTGVVKIALNGGRPDDPNFGWMMPGGDFMAQDAQGRERILYSYGFLSAHLQTPDGQPLKLNPNIGAQLRFVMPHTMVANAPDSLPLWHFDEAAAIWKEEGLARREGAAYVGTVRHFSSWNLDVPNTWCRISGRMVDCKGKPAAFAPVRLGQLIVTTDSSGYFSCRVPSNFAFTIRAQNGTGQLSVGPFADDSDNSLADLVEGATIYGFAVIGIDDTLRIEVYNTKGRVEYSIDNGRSFDTLSRYATRPDISYQVFVRDSLDCPVAIPYLRIPRHADCIMHDSAGLYKQARFDQLFLALSSNQPVYRLALENFGISPNVIFDNLNCLQNLYFNALNLPVLSPTIEQLTQLQRLHIIADDLTALPASIGNLSQLLWLVLNTEQLSGLPETIGNLSQLVRLEVTNCRISSLPNEVGKLKLLKTLRLENNRLASLPDSFGNLALLPELYLQGNRLTSLPESIGNLSSLKRADLSWNQLTALPESFGNLSNVQFLNLSNNQLTTLPDSIENLTSLRELNLRGNPIAPEDQARIISLLPDTIIYF